MNRELRVVRRSHRRPANLARERSGGKSFRYAVTDVPVTGLFVSPELTVTGARRYEAELDAAWACLDWIEIRSLCVKKSGTAEG